MNLLEEKQIIELSKFQIVIYKELIAMVEKLKKDTDNDILSLSDIRFSIEKRNSYKKPILLVLFIPVDDGTSFDMEVYNDGSGILYIREADMEIEFSPSHLFYDSCSYPDDIIEFVYSFISLEIEIVTTFVNNKAIRWVIKKKYKKDLWKALYAETHRILPIFGESSVKNIMFSK